MAVRSANINVMAKAVEAAGRGLVRDFGELENLQVSRKGPADFVSTADTRTEKILVKELTKARPEIGFLLEEGGEIKGEDETKRWIIDPLDGTTNFLHGIPHFAISIALEENGEIVTAMIYNPITDEKYWAEKAQGAFLNGRRLRVSGRRTMEDAIYATGIPFRGRGDHGRFLNELEAIMKVSAGVRRMGAASLDLAFVAAGRFDGFWETGLQTWDIAAGILIVKEAGGFVSEFDARQKMLKSGNVVAGNEFQHNLMLKTFRDARKRG
ncbi:Inositol-1-monophosphatase [Candidatus Terasakiella magnetica]|uniref:Inositol-1-monophosphatase n=1 Tax=Candidatus Terasakiella magnetica TaxID=1867952 RepID=A0A1C3RHK9_9PROT|nr:inositol monophosphatase family protein [Candidatus Terasakiella magnetica]SCA56768.1 Inositol-1-monophosphatase [Candidatus Terasakiella magnetica]